MKTNFSLLLLCLSSQVFAFQPDIDVVYGEDNRVDVYESKDSALVELSRATAGMMSSENLKARGNEYEIVGKTLRDRGVCAKERFSSQITAAKCSGFLVTDNILVTAGHCIKSMSECQSSKWVFDFKMSQGKSTITVPSSSVYNCKRVVSRAQDVITKADFAVIELDRRVNDRRPLSFRTSGTISVGERVAVIGHPTGLPTKISDDGVVRSLQRGYFVTNLDTYHGNSGSAVINQRTGEVEGILVRGDNDYVRDSSGCQISKVCAETGCRGEDVTSITSVEALKKL